MSDDGFSTNKWGLGRQLPVPGGAHSDQGGGLMRYPSLGILGLFGLLFLLIISGSWYTIDQTQRGVLLRNGGFIEVEQPGLHFKLPLIESVYKIDVQTHTRTYGAGQETMEAYSADQQPAHLRVSVTFHVAPDKAQEMYNRFAGDMEAAISRLITPRTDQCAGSVECRCRQGSHRSDFLRP